VEGGEAAAPSAGPGRTLQPGGVPMGAFPPEFAPVPLFHPLWLWQGSVARAIFLTS